MQSTGERYLPEFDGDIALEHVHRYLLAREFAAGKAVLDIACGAGYGSRMLADVAKSVVGVDISREVIARAAAAYAHPGLSFLAGNATAIPLADDSVDMVTSFETIEHLAEHEALLREFRRVLRPGGLLMISSPDRYEYSDRTGYANPYHVRELYREEFEKLLKSRFSHVRTIGQRIVFGSLMGAKNTSRFLSWRGNDPASRVAGLDEAMYHIALAGDAALPALPSSVLKRPLEESDRVNELKQLQREMQGHLEGAWGRLENYEKWEKEAREYIGILETQKHDLEKQYKDLGEEYMGLAEQHRGLTERHRDLEKHHRDLSGQQRELVEQQRELTERHRDLEKHHLDLSGQQRELVAQHRELDQRRHDLERELQSVYASRSWRITAPLRFAMGLLRRPLRRHPVAVATAPAPVWPPDVRALERPLALDGPISPGQGGIGAFVHMYYPELAGEMLACLRHLPDSAGIHVSTDTGAKRKTLLKFFAREGLAERTEIRVCPNKGWDIAPFLIGFADAIPRYKLILRLHSKRSPQIPGDVGETWRRMLFSSLAGSVARAGAVMGAFARDPRLGMVCPPIVEHYAHCVHVGGNFPLMRDLLRTYGITIQPDTPIDFPMGSMFWCRPEVLAPWLEQRFSYDDFAPLAEDERDSSLAHALERLFFFGCGITGHTWARLQPLSAM